MRYRKLSPSGDYSWGNSSLDFYINEPAAVGQACKTRLLLFQGEWFLDSSVGTPYFQAILGLHPQSMADAAVQDVVTGTQGLVDISQYSSQIEDRVYSVQMTINTVYGTTVVEMQNFVNF